MIARIVTLILLSSIPIFGNLPVKILANIGQMCMKDQGWRWVYGDNLLEYSSRMESKLMELGLVVHLRAIPFGEKDDCGTFVAHSIDLQIVNPELIPENIDFLTLVKTVAHDLSSEIFVPVNKIEIVDKDGHSNQMDISKKNDKPLINSPNVKLTPASLPVLSRKVYVIIYDPLLSNGQHLNQYKNWNDYGVITQGTIDAFRQASQGQISYTVVYTSVVEDGWPVKVDGYRYSESEYLGVLAGTVSPHVPDNVDYNKIVNDTRFDLCGKVNRAEIDEVWIYNGPYFGFYESTLVGPDAYWYNSSPVPTPYSCNRLIPLMGPSPERGVAEAAHNFGHRMESSMTRVYGSWEQNRILHNWEKYALVKELSPNFSYSGCGNIHYPPNGQSGYDYGNTGATQSNCDDFVNYPSLNNPLLVLQPVSCARWNCDHLSYLEYWFSHLPSNPSCDLDKMNNDWWIYFAQPEKAINPSTGCLSYRVFIPAAMRKAVALWGNVAPAIIATINIPSSPYGVGVDWTTNRVFVTALQSNKLLTINGVSNTIEATTTVGSGPHSVAVNQATHQIFTSNNTGGTVSVVDGATGQMMDSVAGLFSNPVGITVDSTRNQIFVAHGAYYVAEIDGNAKMVSQTFFTGCCNGYIALNPIINRAYVTKNPPGTLSVMDLSSGIKLIDVVLGGQVDGISVNPATNRVYVTNNISNTLHVIDGITHELVATINVGSGPTDVTVNPVSNCIYVANANSGTVSIINGSSNSVFVTLPVGTDPKSIAVNPQTNRVYVANKGNNTLSVIDNANCSP